MSETAADSEKMNKTINDFQEEMKRMVMEGETFVEEVESVGDNNDEMPELESVGDNNDEMPELESVGDNNDEMPGLESVGDNNDEMPGLESVIDAERGGWCRCRKCVFLQTMFGIYARIGIMEKNPDSVSKDFDAFIKRCQTI
jgi:hypothetical protein